MDYTMSGQAWVFQGILDVDWEICPYETLRMLREKGGPITYEELGKYCMTKVDPDFPDKVQKGDFIVAGENMGYGHDHDHACMSIRGAGVGAVLCESTNANFLRNCIEHGLPIIEIKGISSMAETGSKLQVDLVNGSVNNLGTGEMLNFRPFPEFLLEMLKDGGLYPHLEKQQGRGDAV
jgi:3-isopropylmalate/(R)-2-methylmalate dehydratase small subunit